MIGWFGGRRDGTTTTLNSAYQWEMGDVFFNVIGDTTYSFLRVNYKSMISNNNIIDLCIMLCAQLTFRINFVMSIVPGNDTSRQVIYVGV